MGCRTCGLSICSPAIPARVVGRVSGPGAAPGRVLAVALNGVIRATTRTHQDRNSVRFSAMLPEDAFVSGRNSIDVFEVVEPGSSLLRIPTNTQERFSLIAGLVGGDGHALPPASDLRGQLERVELLYEGLSVSGWADVSPAEAPVARVVVFGGDRLLYVGRPTTYRPDAQRSTRLPPVGFEIRIPLPSGPIDPAAVRVFVVTATGSSGELTRPQ
jgi:hypothetical protein